MHDIKTPIALNYLFIRRRQIIDQMSRLIDVSDGSKWDIRAKAELTAMQEEYDRTTTEIDLIQFLTQ